MFCQQWRQKIHNALVMSALSIFLRGEHYDMYFFSVKQNVKDIFIVGHRRKAQEKESDISKSIQEVKLW